MQLTLGQQIIKSLSNIEARLTQLESQCALIDGIEAIEKQVTDIYEFLTFENELNQPIDAVQEVEVINEPKPIDGQAESTQNQLITLVAQIESDPVTLCTIVYHKNKGMSNQSIFHHLDHIKSPLLISENKVEKVLWAARKAGFVQRKKLGKLEATDKLRAISNKEAA